MIGMLLLPETPRCTQPHEYEISKRPVDPTWPLETLSAFRSPFKTLADAATHRF